jgi:hypothetical protein
VRGWLVALAAGWLVLTAVWVNSDWMLANFGHGTWQLRQWGVPFFVAGFDKTFESLPRLLHLLSLAYILSLPGIIPRIAAARVLEPIRMLGRHSLPVFATGTVLAIAGQVVKTVHPGGFVQDSALIFGGLALQFVLAYLRDRYGPKARRSAKKLAEAHHAASVAPAAPTQMLIRAAE